MKRSISTAKSRRSFGTRSDSIDQPQPHSPQRSQGTQGIVPRPLSATEIFPVTHETFSFADHYLVRLSIAVGVFLSVKAVLTHVRLSRGIRELPSVPNGIADRSARRVAWHTFAVGRGWTVRTLSAVAKACRTGLPRRTAGLLLLSQPVDRSSRCLGDREQLARTHRVVVRLLRRRNSARESHGCAHPTDRGVE